VIEELLPEQLRRTFDHEASRIDTTENLKPLEGIIGQKRAVSAMLFGLEIRETGFNVYVAGPPGIGKMTAVKSFLEELAGRKEIPPDWCYVNDFEDSYKPRIVKLPAGRGRQIQQDMKSLIEHSQRVIPGAFESEEYGVRRDEITKALESERSKVLERFNAQANDPCASHGMIIFPGNTAQDATGLCGQPIGSVMTAVANLQTAFQAANAALTSSSPNPSYLGQALNSQQGLLAPNYQTPRSVQMNIGFQKQIRQATLFSVDYVRNVGTHYLLGYDTNHVGDALHLNTNAALNAINATLATNPLSSACLPATSAGASSQTAVNCYLAAVPGANIADFANHGLDSGGQFLAGAPASLFGLTPDTGAAFPGANPLVGRNTMFFPAGRSLYSGVQVSLRTQIGPMREVRGGSLQLSYSHSSFRSNVAGGLGDQELLPLAVDFNHPTAFFGSASQDRKNQFSLASILDMPYGARLGLIAHFASPLPQTLFLPAGGGVGGEIFRTDVTGDGAFGGQSQTGAGSYGDILPGTNIGSFGRAVKASSVNTVIENYNANFSDKLTPAGQALVNASLFSRSQLLRLGADLPSIQAAPPGNVNLAWLRTLDVTLARPLKIGDRLVLEPSVSAFNVLNFANFDAPGNRLSGALNGTAGTVNGTAAVDRAANRIGPGSGVFSLGAPRQLQFGLKLTF